MNDTRQVLLYLSNFLSISIVLGSDCATQFFVGALTRILTLILEIGTLERQRCRPLPYTVATQQAYLRHACARGVQQSVHCHEVIRV